MRNHHFRYIETRPPNLSLSSEADLREARRRHTYAVAALREPPPRFSRRTLACVIERVAAKVADRAPPSTSSVRRWARALEVRGDVRDLISRHDLKGSRARKLPREVLDEMYQAIEDCCRHPRRPPATWVHAHLAHRLLRLSEILPREKRLPVPSIETLRREIRRVEAVSSWRSGRVLGRSARFRSVLPLPPSLDDVPLLPLRRSRSSLARNRPHPWKRIETAMTYDAPVTIAPYEEEETDHES